MKQKFVCVFIIIISLFFLLSISKVLLCSKKNKTNLYRDVSLEKINYSALERYSGGLKIKTVSNANYNETNFVEFEKFIKYLKETYPIIFKKAEFKRINKYALVFKIKGKNQNLKPNILTAHYDVVGAQAEEKWLHAPFSGYFDNEYIYSRGTLDDKSSFFAILEAVNELLKENYVPEADLYLAFSHTEETGSDEGAKKIIEYFKKHNIYFSTILDEGGRVVNKDGNYFALIGTGEKGRILAKITINATAKHASMPDKNAAVVKLAKLILAFDRNKYKPLMMPCVHEYYLKTYNSYDLITKYLLANKNIFSKYLFKKLSENPEDNARINSTFAITVVKASDTSNVISSQASMILDVRVLPEHKIEDIKKYIEQLVKKTLPYEDVKIEYLSILNPSQPTKTNTKEYKLLEKNIDKIFPNITVVPYLVLGATDAGEYAQIADNAFRFLPVILTEKDVALMHADNEKISVKNWLRMISFYKEFILTR